MIVLIFGILLFITIVIAGLVVLADCVTDKISFDILIGIILVLLGIYVWLILVLVRLLQWYIYLYIYVRYG